MRYKNSKWYASRWNKNEKKNFHNGYYDNEETAAHASDTLARKLMENGEQGHKLNFPDDHTEVHPKEVIDLFKDAFLILRIKIKNFYCIHINIVGHCFPYCGFIPKTSNQNFSKQISTILKDSGNDNRILRLIFIKISGFRRP